MLVCHAACLLFVVIRGLNGYGDPKPWLKSVEDPQDKVSPRHRWGPFRLTPAEVGKKLAARVVLELREKVSAAGAGGLGWQAVFVWYFIALSTLVADDIPSILENPSIRQLWPLSVPLNPPHDLGATVGGRPVYLRDVARVTHGHKDREAITRVNGRECIELAIYKEGDSNTTAGVVSSGGVAGFPLPVLRYDVGDVAAADADGRIERVADSAPAREIWLEELVGIIFPVPRMGAGIGIPRGQHRGRQPALRLAHHHVSPPGLHVGSGRRSRCNF